MLLKDLLDLALQPIREESNTIDIKIKQNVLFSPKELLDAIKKEFDGIVLPPKADIDEMLEPCLRILKIITPRSNGDTKQFEVFSVELLPGLRHLALEHAAKILSSYQIIKWNGQETFWTALMAQSTKNNLKLLDFFLRSKTLKLKPFESVLEVEILALISAYKEQLTNNNPIPEIDPHTTRKRPKKEAKKHSDQEDDLLRPICEVFEAFCPNDQCILAAFELYHLLVPSQSSALLLQALFSAMVTNQPEQLHPLLHLLVNACKTRGLLIDELAVALQPRRLPYPIQTPQKKNHAVFGLTDDVPTISEAFSFSTSEPIQLTSNSMIRLNVSQIVSAQVKHEVVDNYFSQKVSEHGKISAENISSPTLIDSAIQGFINNSGNKETKKEVEEISGQLEDDVPCLLPIAE